MHNNEFLPSKAFLPTNDFSKELSTSNCLSLVLLGENVVLVYKACAEQNSSAHTQYCSISVADVIFISRFAKINIVSKTFFPKVQYGSAVPR